MPPYVYLENGRATETVDRKVPDSPQPAFYRGGAAATNFDHGTTLPEITRHSTRWIDGRKDDAEGVYLDWGQPAARVLSNTTPAELSRYEFPAGSMGPKVESACEFVKLTGRTAAIGSLADIQKIVEGQAGTIIKPD